MLGWFRYDLCTNVYYISDTLACGVCGLFRRQFCCVPGFCLFDDVKNANASRFALPAKLVSKINKRRTTHDTNTHTKNTESCLFVCNLCARWRMDRVDGHIIHNICIHIIINISVLTSPARRRRRHTAIRNCA